MRNDPARLTLSISGYFTEGCVAVQLAQALGLLLNPTWD